MAQNDQKTAEEVLNDEIHTQTDGNQNIDFRHQLAHQSVKNWSQWATVAGFIPVPFVDTAAITALQIKMINSGRFEPKEEADGLGVENTKGRLALLYEDAASFEIQNLDEQHVITLLNIPL